MGKFRSKLKGQTKGKRWPKGQSSSSNPETHKHRDLAKSRFFEANSSESTGLTYDLLKRHDATQSCLFNNKEETTQMEDESVESSSMDSYSTMKTFASEWSDCSNMSYSRFLKVFKSDSALHKEMLAILAAITEVIKENGGTESSTEYYCSLLTTLEQVYNQEEKNNEQISAVLSLLNMGIKTVPEGVLRKNFNDVVNKMLYILNDYADSDNNVIIKSVFGILGWLLHKQEHAMWSPNSITCNALRAILNPFSIHSKPKWRKAAQNAALLAVKAESLKDIPLNPAADLVAEFCEDTLERCMGGSSTTGEILVSSVQAGQTTILHTMGLMRNIIFYFSKNHIKSCCEMVLRLITLNYPIVTSCGLQVLHSLFSHQTVVVPAKMNAQLISALYEFQPAPADVQPTLAWLAVMQQAHVHLADADLGMAAGTLPKIFATITQLWLSDKAQVMNAATHSLEVLLKDAVAPLCVTKEMVKQNLSKLQKCFGAIEEGLRYQYHTVWHQVLHLLGVIYEIGGSNCSDLLMNSLKTLSELRDSYKFSYNNELEHAVGAAVRSMGPETVLNIISLSKENGDLNLDRSWMLPVLKENIKTSTLDYFVKGILPLAIYCQKRANQLAQINDGIGAHSSELLYMQLWNLLPCFCNNPSDIKENFKLIAKVLGMAISDKKELRLAVMASLRRLISCAKENQNSGDIEELQRFDKNYLPILFNVYTQKPMGSDEEGQRLAALDTIKIYLTIARPELTQQLLNHAIERLNSSSDDPEDLFIKESILDLIRALVPYQNVQNIKILYEQCIKPLPEIKNKKEQKKAYRLLEEICSSNSESCLEFVKNNRKEVQRLLMKALNSTAVSSKGARLRCFNFLIKAQPQLDHESKLIRSVIPEAVLSCKDINERTRAIAYQILNTIGETLLKHNQLEQFITMIITGLAGTIQLVSCTILALSSILHNFSGSLGQENIQKILDNICILTSSPTREITGACLAFIKIYCKTLPSPMVAASLPIIVKSLCNMSEDCKRHFRLKTRDILDRLVKKYGCESITPHIPVTDVVMYKRLRNLRKLNARKKRQKEEQNKDENDEDDEFVLKQKTRNVDDILADSDSDDFDDDSNRMDFEATKKRKVNTWIEEDLNNIVDFTDNSAVSKIITTKPGQSSIGPIQEKKKDKDRGFKTASDGRLIIKDDSSSDDDENDNKNNKISFNSDSDDDEADGKSIASTLILSDRKRKRAASVKSGMSETSHPSMKYKTGGVGIHRNTKTPGSDYKATKAKGDVKKKGKLDPYAYLPLQRTILNKRKKKKVQGQFKNIIKAAKTGALKGAKAKKNKLKLV